MIIRNLFPDLSKILLIILSFVSINSIHLHNSIENLKSSIILMFLFFIRCIRFMNDRFTIDTFCYVNCPTKYLTKVEINEK